MISTKDLTKKFGDLTAVDHLPLGSKREADLQKGAFNNQGPTLSKGSRQKGILAD